MTNQLKPQKVSDPDRCILVVDDEEFNLELITEMLEDEQYQVETAENGVEACSLLEADPEKYDAVVLDRMMPKMGGIEVMQRMQVDPRLRLIPIIMQSAKASRVDIQKGLDAGVLYYLTKPFERETLLAIVGTAVSVYAEHIRLRSQVGVQREPAIKQSKCIFRTIDEARSTATLLASGCAEPERIVTGLCELFINAIEHGNLGIGYEGKTQLHQEGRWEQEVERRMKLPENSGKRVTVTVEQNAEELQFRIHDDGQGFDSQRFLIPEPSRAADTHGRGIAMARLMSFDRIEYLGCGNEVLAVVKNAI